MVTLKGIIHFIQYRSARLLFLRKDRKYQFTKIHRSGGFNPGSESLSGIGSDISHTEGIRNEVSSLLKKYDITSIIDAPCGDFNWMSQVDLSSVHYLGVDIVDQLIESNRRKYRSDTLSFKVMDLVVDPLPKSDLILCRDCLIHLKLRDSLKLINNFRSSGSTWLLTTSYRGLTKNVELGTDFFRPVDLSLPPFSFPQPTEFISDWVAGDDKRFTDKILGLWRLSELPKL